MKPGNQLGKANWRDGTTRRKDGRIEVSCPQHPHAYATGRVLRARLVAEWEILHRLLLPGEVVHHRNGVVDDDRPENLAVMANAEHTALHQRQG